MAFLSFGPSAGAGTVQIIKMLGGMGVLIGYAGQATGGWGPVIYQIPEDIEIVLDKPTLFTVKGIDKQRVGQEAHKIRSFRKPDPYKHKGIRYVGERLIKKERKAGAANV